MLLASWRLASPAEHRDERRRREADRLSTLLLQRQALHAISPMTDLPPFILLRWSRLAGLRQVPDRQRRLH